MHPRKFFLIHAIIIAICAGIAVVIFFATGANPDRMGFIVPTVFMGFIALATFANMLVNGPRVIITHKILSKGIEVEAKAIAIKNLGYTTGTRQAGGQSSSVHRGFTVEVEYTDESGNLVKRLVRTRFAERVMVDDLMSIGAFQIRYIGKRIEIPPQVLAEFYIKHPKKKPKGFRVEAIGSYHRTRAQVERDEQRKEERSKLTRKERHKEHLKDGAVTSRFVYWVGIFYVLTILVCIGVTIYLFSQHADWLGGVGFAGTFVWTVIGGLLYMRARNGQFNALKRDPMATLHDGKVTDIEYIDKTFSRLTWSVRLKVDEFNPVAIIKSNSLDLSFVVGDIVPVLFNPNTPDLCVIIIEKIPPKEI